MSCSTSWTGTAASMPPTSAATCWSYTRTIWPTCCCPTTRDASLLLSLARCVPFSGKPLDKTYNPQHSGTSNTSKTPRFPASLLLADLTAAVLSFFQRLSLASPNTPNGRQEWRRMFSCCQQLRLCFLEHSRLQQLFGAEQCSRNAVSLARQIGWIVHQQFLVRPTHECQAS